MDASTEREALVEVARRLTGRFQQLPPDLVTETVNDFAGQLQAAKIRDFIPLLVERQARDALHAHLAAVVVPVPRTELVHVDA